MKPETPVRAAWVSVRANAAPMFVLWTCAALLLALYYAVPGGARLFGPLMDWQTKGGCLAAFLNRVLFLGALPGVFLLSVRSIRPPRPLLTVLAYSLWGGAWGVFDDVFFTFLVRCYGTGTDFATLALKTLTGQLVGTILVGLVPGTLFFRWVAADFSVARVRAEWPKRFFREACLSLLLANWIVWIPVNVCTYAFPLPLQIQLVGLAGCFWMLVGLQTGRRMRRTRATGRALCGLVLCLAAATASADGASPAPAQPEPLLPSRFGVINDTHSDAKSFAFTAAVFKRRKFPLAVWNGDAVNGKWREEAVQRAFVRPEIPDADFAAGTRMLFLPGNHELDGGYVPHLAELLPEVPDAGRVGRFASLRWNFAVRQGEIAIIGLDTGSGFHDDDRRASGFRCSPYRRLQAAWLEEALRRPEIAGAPFLVACCHIPLYNSGVNTNGCEAPLRRGCCSWVRECHDLWGPLLDRAGVQLVIAGHEHQARWDDEVPGFRWKQVLGGGPELGHASRRKPDPSRFPTVIECAVESGRLVVTVTDAWHDREVSRRTFERRFPRGRVQDDAAGARFCIHLKPLAFVE